MHSPTACSPLLITEYGIRSIASSAKNVSSDASALIPPLLLTNSAIVISSARSFSSAYESSPTAKSPIIETAPTKKDRRSIYKLLCLRRKNLQKVILITFYFINYKISS
ncbi:hypothetical protein E4U03_12510 [Rothia nasimurium]|uniref:Uncharacterized protein n=1 Tax=Rothia nasimurium TaxID=85336 RepID=A0A4Y9EZX7_9MICC|nr:hypothetical protein [Rothia nasimurium]TFU19246.1 hypothetical protein E4U03_12510 [Rothia nasimurium]